MTEAQTELLAYVVLFTPLSATLIVALGGTLFHFSRRWIDRLTIGLASVSAVASLLLAMTPVEEVQFTLPVLNINIYLDALSIYFLLLVNLVAFFAACYVPSFLGRQDMAQQYNKAIRFHTLFNFFHFTMVLVPMVDNLVLLWMAVELTTLASTLLVRYHDDRRALEAAWKYLMITTTGIIFALLGTALLSTAVIINAPLVVAQGPEFDRMSWQTLSRLATPTTIDKTIMELAFLFALVGYGTKAGFAPMHTWLPDGHGEAPSPVSALLSGVLLKSALFAILRFYTLTNLTLGNNQFTSSILLMVGIFSLTVATPFILKRNRFKRLLAYHSLEHMGIIAFGLGIGTPVAVFGALLHTLNHALTKALMFLTYGHAQTLYTQHAVAPTGLADDEPLHGIMKTLPLHGGLLAMGGLALVGSPPFNIFQSEFIILWGAVNQPNGTAWNVVAVTIFLISVTLIFGGLVVHLARLLLGPAPFHLPRESVRQILPLLGLMAIITVFGFVVLSWPINFPQLIQDSTCIVIRTGPISLCSH